MRRRVLKPSEDPYYMPVQKYIRSGKDLDYEEELELNDEFMETAAARAGELQQITPIDQTQQSLESQTLVIKAIDSTVKAIEELLTRPIDIKTTERVRDLVDNLLIRGVEGQAKDHLQTKFRMLIADIRAAINEKGLELSGKGPEAATIEIILNRAIQLTQGQIAGKKFAKIPVDAKLQAEADRITKEKDAIISSVEGKIVNTSTMTIAQMNANSEAARQELSRLAAEQAQRDAEMRAHLVRNAEEAERRLTSEIFINRLNIRDNTAVLASAEASVRDGFDGLGVRIDQVPSRVRDVVNQNLRQNAREAAREGDGAGKSVQFALPLNRNPDELLRAQAVLDSIEEEAALQRAFQSRINETKMIGKKYGITVPDIGMTEDILTLVNPPATLYYYIQMDSEGILIMYLKNDAGYQVSVFITPDANDDEIENLKDSLEQRRGVINGIITRISGKTTPIPPSSNAVDKSDKLAEFKLSRSSVSGFEMLPIFKDFSFGRGRPSQAKINEEREKLSLVNYDHTKRNLIGLSDGIMRILGFIGDMLNPDSFVPQQGIPGGDGKEDEGEGEIPDQQLPPDEGEE